MLLRDTALVNLYYQLFEQTWAQLADKPAASVVDADLQALREREREMLDLLAAGLTDEMISRRTGVSVRTIRRTVAALMDRLGARSRFQAGALAARHWGI
ncbi:helix-turn-helix domain-containing protein [Streptomyces sp. YGL11-2]|uniref:helix-turn-helix domain-containing protein n=1 Tax=Streptomyces sp. YGL11-2 TaxID=3414028 RepID=UPI003CF73406